MSEPKIYTIKEAAEYLKSENPRYMTLMNYSGKTIVGYNKPSNKNFASKWREIEETFNKKGLTDGIYVIEYCTHFTKNHDRFKINVGKGNYDSLPAKIVERPPVTITAVSENVWDAKEAVKIISERDKYIFLYDEACKTIKLLEQEIKDLETEQSKKQLTDPGDGEKNFLDSLNKFGEVFSPTIEKFFNLQEKKLKLKETELANAGARKEIANDPNEQYFIALHNIFVNGTDEEWEAEMDYLENNFPDVYKEVCEHYNEPAE